MKLLMHISYLSEYPVVPLTSPIDPSALTGRTMEVTGAYPDPFTGDWLLVADVSDPVDPIPPELEEILDLGFESECNQNKPKRRYNRHVEDEWGNSYDPEPPNFD